MEHLYMAKTRINGQEKVYYATLKQLREGNLWCEMHPLIWYVVKNARTKLETLPLMDPEVFHFRTEKPGMQARFCILNKEISEESLDAVGSFPELQDEIN